jgi:hypothetical protein
MLGHRSSKRHQSTTKLHQSRVNLQSDGNIHFVDDALNQIQHCTYDIVQLFGFNSLVVVSDGVNSLHSTPHCTHAAGAGVWPATPSRIA